MPRNMSFSLTTPQTRAKAKTVTRRMGWLKLKPGELLNACVKCQGLKLGETVERICQIKVTSVRRERLSMMTERPTYGERECVLEGFPELTPAEFVSMFAASHGCTTGAEVTRIEFEYL